MALTGEWLPTHEPVEVIATLRTGIGLDPPYGLDLAGLLATRMRACARVQREAEGALRSSPLPDTTMEDPEDMGLPLGRCTSAGDQWHWLASCAQTIAPEPDPEPRMFYRVLDSAWMQRAGNRPLTYHHPSKGPYRDFMVPAPVVVCRQLVWRAIGDTSRIEALLKGVAFLGRRRTTGEGRVLSWSLRKPVGLDESPASWLSWVHAQGDVLLRPVPVVCADALGLPYRLGAYALRPPSWHPDRLIDLAMSVEEDEEW